MNELSELVLSTLRCPHCANPLSRAGELLECPGCRVHYQKTKNGALDMRLKQEKRSSFEFVLGTPYLQNNPPSFEPIKRNKNPDLNFAGVRAPHHLSKELLSYFPKANDEFSLMLDLGCGDTVHRTVAEYAGFEYVGLDYENKKAPILGDAHALPFADESFEFVLSIAVLEHIQYPFVMTGEIYRVLKPGGVFLGTVAFLEPFHSNSYYHHSHLGTFNSIQASGFQVEWVSPSRRWTVLKAQSKWLFHRMPFLLRTALIFPLHALHRIWWKLASVVRRESLESLRLRSTAGSFAFYAKKPYR